MKKRIISMILSIVMVIGMLPISVFATETDNLRNFTKRNSYTNNTFDDVQKDDWFYENVKSVYELGLMQGKGENKFDTESGITIAETLTIAARLHSIYFTRSDTFEASNPWYQVYADYCAVNGITSVNSDTYSQTATRAEFVMILANALPAEVFVEINKVATNAIPDVDINDTYGAAVYKMYRAGIMIGNDDIGTFAPSSEIKRSEVATIVARMVDVSLRKSIQLGNEYTVTFNMNGHGKQIDSQTVVEGYTAEKPTDPTKSTYVFKGWYTQTIGGQQFDFNMPITEDITLYARWEMDPLWLALMMGWMNNQNNNDGNNGNQTYTVTFEANGNNVVNIPTTQYVEQGNYASKPSEPVRTGYEFGGWYTDSNTVLRYSFDKPVNTNINLYANWHFNDGEFSICDVDYDSDRSEITTYLTTKTACKIEYYVVSDDYDRIYYSSVDTALGELSADAVSHHVRSFLPDSFIIVVKLTDEFGNELCDRYTYEEETSAYKEFINKTVSDYEAEGGKVINLDDQNDTNFMVASDDVNILYTNSNMQLLSYDEATGTYIFNGADAFGDFSAGDKIVIVDGNEGVHTILLTNISITGDAVTITSDQDTALGDFFYAVKINTMGYGTVVEDGGASTYSLSMRSIPDVDIEETPLEKKFSKRFTNEEQNKPVTYDVNINGTALCHVVLYYDLILLGKDYLKAEFTVSVDADLEASLTYRDGYSTADNDNFKFNIVDLNFPIPITAGALAVSAELQLIFEWSIDAFVSLDLGFSKTIGFRYLLEGGHSDFNPINDESFEHDVNAGGNFTAKAGIEASVNLELCGDLWKASLPFYVGLHLDAEAEGTMLDAINGVENTGDSYHACELCLDGDIYFDLTGKVRSTYYVTKDLNGTIFNNDLFTPIHEKLIDFYLSITNDPDSIHEGIIDFGFGTCPNMKWKTTFYTVDSSFKYTDDPVSAYIIRGINQYDLIWEGKSKSSEYFYNGGYIAKSNVGGSEYSQTFTIDDAAKTVFINVSGSNPPVDPEQPDDDDPIIPIIPPTDETYNVTGTFVYLNDANEEIPVSSAVCTLTDITNSNMIYEAVVSEGQLTSAFTMSSQSLPVGTYTLHLYGGHDLSPNDIDSRGFYSDKVIDNVVVDSDLDLSKIYCDRVASVSCAVTNEDNEYLNNVGMTITQNGATVMRIDRFYHGFDVALKKGDYTLTLTCEGYTTYTAAFTVNGTTDLGEIILSKEKQITATGECGQGVYWELYGSTLRIYGSGAMTAFTSNDSQPWYHYGNTIRTVIVDDGVTEISPLSFALMRNLETISFGKDVRVTGVYAFQNCTKLEKVTFTGDAPILNRLGIYYDATLFGEMSLTVYYPYDNDTWTETYRTENGVNVTWIGT